LLHSSSAWVFANDIDRFIWGTDGSFDMKGSCERLLRWRKDLTSGPTLSIFEFSKLRAEGSPCSRIRGRVSVSELCIELDALVKELDHVILNALYLSWFTRLVRSLRQCRRLTPRFVLITPRFSDISLFRFWWWRIEISGELALPLHGLSRHAVLASQVSPNCCRRVDFDSLGDTWRWGFEQLPAQRDLVGWAGQLEVIHVYDEKEFVLRMKVATPPRAAFNETFGQDMAFAVLFPVTP
jgi:hypothetical protein